MTTKTTSKATASKELSHELVFEKNAERALTENKTFAAWKKLVETLNTQKRENAGWTIALVPYSKAETASRRKDEENPLDTAYIYSVKVKVSLAYDIERSSIGAEFQAIVSSAVSKAATAKWNLVTLDGKEYVAPTHSPKDSGADEFSYAPLIIPDDWESFFSHLYGLDPHISRMKRAIEAAVRSNFEKRPHTALIGPPGCGKSDLVQSMKNALGENAVIEFDATSTTSAGALKGLDDLDLLPRIMVVEEIEKAAEGSMQWLLAIMDIRAAVMKRTARGNIDLNTKMLVFATVNDLPTFNKVAFGALGSRFANKLFFRRPDRDLMGQILMREVSSIEGDPAWVEPCLDLAEELKIEDVREISSMLWCGREDLLNGKYRKEILATSQTPVDVDEDDFVMEDDE